MRTPNTECALCKKPLYRRAFEFTKARYFACMACRSEAQKVAGITERQHSGLSLGRQKGTNHRAGYKHKEESKRKIGQSNVAFWEAHPERAAARGEKTRGELHRQWKGGVSKLNLSIRQMTENRKWMDAIKARDGCCVRCGSAQELESHHIVPLADIMERLGIASRADARAHAAEVWDLANGETLCRPCHYAEHGRLLRAA